MGTFHRPLGLAPPPGLPPCNEGVQRAPSAVGLGPGRCWLHSTQAPFRIRGPRFGSVRRLRIRCCAIHRGCGYVAALFEKELLGVPPFWGVVGEMERSFCCFLGGAKKKGAKRAFNGVWGGLELIDSGLESLWMTYIQPFN